MKLIFLNSLNIKPINKSSGSNNSFLEMAPPLGLMILAGAARKIDGVDPVIIDLNEEADSLRFPSSSFFTDLYGKIRRKIAIHLHGDDQLLLGLQSLCNSHHLALHLAEKIRHDFPKSTLFMGGPHPSITAGETLANYADIDFILAGEADTSILDFLHALQKRLHFSDVPGLYYRKRNGSIASPKRFDVQKNLDSLPFQDYVSYPYTPHGIYIEIGRGCPFACAYCSTSSFFSRTPRYKSIDRITAEIDQALAMGYESFTVNFIHDHFLAREEYAVPLLDELENLAKRKELTWTCSARPDSITKELAGRLKKANLSSIYLGIESGSPHMQKMIRKNLNVQNSLRSVKMLRDQNIETTCSFIQGFPNESKTDTDSTLSTMAICSLYGAIIQYHPLTWMPGTVLFEQYKEHLVYSPGRENTQYHPGTAVCLSEKPTSREIFSVFYKLAKFLPEADGISRIALSTLQDYPMTFMLAMRPWEKGNSLADEILEWKQSIGEEQMALMDLTLWIGDRLARRPDRDGAYDEVLRYERDKVAAYIALHSDDGESPIPLKEFPSLLSHTTWNNFLVSISEKCVRGDIFTSPSGIAESIAAAFTTRRLELPKPEEPRHKYILRVNHNQHNNLANLVHIRIHEKIRAILDCCNDRILLGELREKCHGVMSDTEFWFVFIQLLNLNILAVFRPIDASSDVAANMA